MFPVGVPALVSGEEGIGESSQGCCGRRAQESRELVGSRDPGLDVDLVLGGQVNAASAEVADFSRVDILEDVLHAQAPGFSVRRDLVDG